MSVNAARVMLIAVVVCVASACSRKAARAPARAPGESPVRYVPDSGPPQARISVRISANAYTPSRVNVIAGRPVLIDFFREPGGCGPGLYIVEASINRQLRENEHVEVTFTPQAGRTEFKCGQRGVRGEIIAR